MRHKIISLIMQYEDAGLEGTAMMRRTHLPEPTHLTLRHRPQESPRLFEGSYLRRCRKRLHDTLSMSSAQYLLYMSHGFRRWVPRDRPVVERTHTGGEAGQVVDDVVVAPEEDQRMNLLVNPRICRGDECDRCAGRDAQQRDALGSHTVQPLQVADTHDERARVLQHGCALVEGLQAGPKYDIPQ